MGRIRLDLDSIQIYFRLLGLTQPKNRFKILLKLDPNKNAKIRIWHDSHVLNFLYNFF